VWYRAFVFHTESAHSQHTYTQSLCARTEREREREEERERERERMHVCIRTHAQTCVFSMRTHACARERTERERERREQPNAHAQESAQGFRLMKNNDFDFLC